MKQPFITIVGAGRLGTAVARHLHAAGYHLSEIVARNRVSPELRQLARSLRARAVTLAAGQFSAGIVWLCVSDSQITTVSKKLASRDWKGKIVFHSSGVLTSDALSVLKERGARIASVHPLMTFVRGVIPSLAEVAFAMEGDRAAIRIAKDIVRRLAGRPVSIRKSEKPAYHLFATMICPLLISLLRTSEYAAGLAHIPPSEARRRMLPIVRQTISNYENLGAAGAFTGPFVRGDAETVRLHMNALSRSTNVKNVCVALAEAALKNLPHQRKSEIQNVLKTFKRA